MSADKPHDALPASHLGYVQIAAAQPFSVYVPPVFRHLPTQYVKDFWDSGQLRLSSFATFKQHKDEQQGDEGEGWGVHVVVDHDRQNTVAVKNSVGASDLVLSTTSAPGDCLPAAFGDAWFEIVDPVAFALDVAVEIAGCIETAVGACVYVDTRLLHTRAPLAPVETLRGADTDAVLKYLAENVPFGPRQYFLKEKRYMNQAEFRFIWRTNKPITDPIFVRQPELRKHCRPMATLTTTA